MRCLYLLSILLWLTPLQPIFSQGVTPATKAPGPKRLTSAKQGLLFNPGEVVVGIGLGAFENSLSGDLLGASNSLPLYLKAEYGLGLGPHHRALWGLDVSFAQRSYDSNSAHSQFEITAFTFMLLHHRAYSERFDLYWGVGLVRASVTTTKLGYTPNNNSGVFPLLLIGIRHAFSPRLGGFAQLGGSAFTPLQYGLLAKF